MDHKVPLDCDRLLCKTLYVFNININGLVNINLYGLVDILARLLLVLTTLLVVLLLLFVRNDIPSIGEYEPGL